MTPLYAASLKGHTEVVKLLLDASADVNKATLKHVTPLHIASQKGHIKIVKLLLDAKANVNAITRFGEEVYTSLRFARDGGYTSIVALFKKNVAKEQSQSQAFDNLYNLNYSIYLCLFTFLLYLPSVLA